MEKELKAGWTNVIHYLGSALLVIGAVDPLEGSVLITIGSGLLTFVAFKNRRKDRNRLIAGFISILVGVFFLFLFSSFGGFGGPNGIAWGWSVLILPYPAGWFYTIGLLLARLKAKPKA
ncbi:MAG: hypothetical protein HPY80_09570 [Bacteroidales bacterium]|jgi:multisubunit Na+/H+ antiporter MnhB subunit|nr:hypothetical protein [Bacteroidales bacterium]